MTSIGLSVLVAMLVLAGGLGGLQLHRFLPQHHLTRETQDVVRLGAGTLSVLTSLVFGLLIGTAKESSDLQNREMRAFSADLIAMDQFLRSYGEDASSARMLLRRFAARTVEDIWPTADHRFVGLDDRQAGALLDSAQDAVRRLVPGDARQRIIQERALDTGAALIRQRWLLIEQAEPSVRPLVLAVLVSWTVALFVSFGLNAPRNGTVVAAFVACSLAIGGAVFLILELDDPLQGILRLSSRPMLHAAQRLGLD